MKRAAIAFGSLVLIGALIAGGWYYRPWSDYSPARIAALSDPADFPQTFQAMDEIFPYRTIAAPAVSTPLPRDVQPLDLRYEWQGETRALDDYLTESRTLGLMVLKNGQVVHEQYRLGGEAEDRFTSWSVAKSFVASLVAIALKEGRIASLDDLAQDYAPQYAGSAYGETSLRHLLMMSAGVAFNEDYEGPESDIRPFFFNAFIMGRDVDDMAAQIERDRPAGEDLHYVSPNSHVLSAVVRAVYDKPLAEIVEEKIWTPLGMQGDAYWSQNVPGERGMAIGYCCLNARLADYARFGQLYLQNGLWDGEQILPAGWVQEATTPPAPFMEPGATYETLGYGLHFWVPQNADGEFYMAGVYGQYIWVDQRRGVVIAINAGDPGYGARRPESIAVFRAIARAVTARDPA